MELLDYGSQSLLDTMLIESDQDRKHLTTGLIVVGKLPQR
jgi:hypothetical protein